MYIIDTDFIINYFKNKKRNVELLTKALSEPDAKVFITSLTVYELIGGAHYSNNFEKNYSLYKELRNSVDVLELDEESAKISGKIYAQLKKKGNNIGDTDILIASICIKNQCTLLTENINHFIKIEDIKIAK